MGSGGENASTTDGLNAALRCLAEEPRLDDDGLVGQAALAEHLGVTGLGHVDDGHAVLVGGVLGAGAFADERPLSYKQGLRSCRC